MAIDVQAVPQTHDDGTFLRTAIQPNEGDGTSIVVLGRNGKPVFKINLFASHSCTTVDVIPVEFSTVMHRKNGNVDWTHEMDANEVNTTFVDHEYNALQ